MGTCFLHIGPHKAASTYLQKSMLSNPDLLESEEISIPRLGENGDGRHHHNLAHELTGRWKFREDAGTFQDLKHFIESIKPKNILLTSENFENAAQNEECFEFLKDFFSPFDYEIRVLAVVRPQTGLINSAYAEQTKRYVHRDTFSEFVESIVQRPKSKYDMNVNFKYWMNYFNCDFIPLNDEVVETGLDRTFFQRLGFAEDKLGRLQRVGTTNKAPGPKTIEAARIIRGILEGLWGKKLQPKDLPGGVELRRALLQRSRTVGWNKTSFYGYDDRLFGLVKDHFSESNDHFSRNVFGRPWSEVFHDRRKPTNVYDHDAAPESEKKQMAEMVKEVFYSMYKA